MWLGKSLGCTFGAFFVRIPAYLVSTATLRPFKKPLKFAKGREIVWESRGCVWECDRTWWNPIFWWFSSCVIILHLKLAEIAVNSAFLDNATCQQSVTAGFEMWSTSMERNQDATKCFVYSTEKKKNTIHSKACLYDHLTLALRIETAEE